MLRKMLLCLGQGLWVLQVLAAVNAAKNPNSLLATLSFFPGSAYVCLLNPKL